MAHSRGGPTLRGQRLAGTAAALVTAAALLTACGPGETKGKATPSPSAPATSASPSADPTATAKDAVLAAYRGMWEQQTKLYNTGSFTGVDLEKYAADKALSNIKVSAVYYQNNGQIVPGAPKISPKITTISLGTDPKTATIVDCVDSSNFTPVIKKTGKKVKLSDSTRRHVETAKAAFFTGKWLIINAEIDKDKTC